jgi:predicted nucleotidyltransferase
MEKEEIIKTIRAFLNELKKYKVREIGVFGSVVRGEQKQESDIDVLVDFEENADLFDLVGLGLFLEERLGRKVDVVPKRALRKEIREFVLKEVVPV